MKSSHEISQTVCMFLEGIPLVSPFYRLNSAALTLCLSGYISAAESPQDWEFIRQCLRRNTPAHLLPESPPHAEGPWLTTRLAHTDPFSVPLQTICNTRLYIVSTFSPNFTKSQSVQAVMYPCWGNPSCCVENKLCKCWRPLHSTQRQ